MDRKMRILFVDDDKNILDGLRRMLWRMHREWEMTFVQSGRQALETMAEIPFDVVVTDMRMPQMDGAELLTLVKDRHPGTVRIILSGYAEKEMTMKAFRMAHQYLVKPSDSDAFKQVIGRMRGLGGLLHNDRLKHLISRTASLPSLPSIYARVMGMLDQPGISAKAVGEVIAQDLGMTARILQLVNSAFFGLPKRFTDISEAVVYLGLQIIRSMAGIGGMFSSLDPDILPDPGLENLVIRGKRVGAIARRIAVMENLGNEKAENAFLAGLLHDVGKLIIFHHFPETYAKIPDAVSSSDLSVETSEIKALGAAHGEIGAYLMGLWGLPEPMVEAIAFHHRPSRRPAETFGISGAVHAADAIVRQMDGESLDDEHDPLFDKVYFDRLGITDRIPAWRETGVCPLLH